MTAPVWMAFPPEIHSALLSSGPGPGPLLAAAGAWSSLSTEYSSMASELTALLGDAQASAWEGPSSARYLAAHAPYIAWLARASADSAAMSAAHETAAAAYTTALATMPTLGELAANHAMHAALVSTNFFGLNTIPIALNEADYTRMWVQAAATMSTYQAVSTAAVAAAPQPMAAPQIMNTDSSSGMNSGSGMSGGSGMGGNPYIMGTSLPQNLQEWLEALFPFNPFSPQGWSMHPSLSMFLSRVETLIPMYAHNPAQLLETIVMLALQFVIHRTLVFINLLLFNPVGLLSFFLSNPIYTLGLATPLLAVPAGAASGLAGLAGLAATTPIPAVTPVPVPAPAMPLTEAPPLTSATTAPTITTAPLKAPSPLPTSMAASAPGGPPSPPPTVVGPESAISAQGFVSPYLVGVLGTATELSAPDKIRKPTPDALTPSTAATSPAALRPRARRRRRKAPTSTDRGYRYEFLDPESEEIVPSDGAGQANSALVSDLGGAPARLAAPATERRAAGLVTLTGDAFGGATAVPMMPSNRLDPD
ncbi:PPE domain-containing protein [Mycobacterium arosiense]|uniref:PPE family protein n=1 Tax=Mycobacterium arosiense ATCC BAA-1401 = DSM 45069 TaxID=1265311 RepID=A0A1W9Z5Y7_MYCAI|nr:PPE domain-containing protein [Mycobacterium arosiense]ORA07803.1 PPE family protein [Mycobacterium arosiense ATCC BAA-1401 = DSM 45069]